MCVSIFFMVILVSVKCSVIAICVALTMCLLSLSVWGRSVYESPVAVLLLGLYLFYCGVRKIFQYSGSEALIKYMPQGCFVLFCKLGFFSCGHVI